ncbi:hypothetical protein D3C81_1667490 [compost metagenome]
MLRDSIGINTVNGATSQVRGVWNRARSANLDRSMTSLTEEIETVIEVLTEGRE